MATFGFIGTGNMGSALARAVVKAVFSGSVILSNHSAEKAAALANELGCRTMNNADIASCADYIFLGVKPQMLAGLSDEIKAPLRNRKTAPVLISMAAGTSIARIYELCGKDYPIIRIMPNTPVSVGEGIILYACSETVSPEAEAEFLSVMSSAGLLSKIPEELIDAGSALSGCGPAFADLFIEALADGAVACGLPRKQALMFAAQMTLGSAKLMLESGEHPGTLKDAVCSPGGSTIEGVRALERSAFRGAVMEAVIAAYEKTKRLS